MKLHATQFGERFGPEMLRSPRDTTQLLVYCPGIMEAMRQSWSDDRLDELNRRLDAGFQRVDARFAGVDGQFKRVDRQFERVDRQFERVDRQFAELRAEMNLRFEHVDARFDALNRTIMQVGGGLIGTLIVTCGALVGIQL
jgi:hypothetical protein